MIMTLMMMMIRMIIMITLIILIVIMIMMRKTVLLYPDSVLLSIFVHLVFPKILQAIRSHVNLFFIIFFSHFLS